MNSQTIESTNILIPILIGLLLKIFLDFKLAGGFNYPLLVKLLYMILIAFALIILLHPDDMKKMAKQAKIDEYFKRQFK